MKEAKTNKNPINHAFSHSTALLNYLFHYKKKFLPILAFIILLIPFIINFSVGKPLLSGAESYYHLSLAQEHYRFTPNYLILLPLISYIPEKILWIIPFLLGVSTIILFINIFEKLKIEEKLSFFFTLLLIASPLFINLFTTISSNALFLFLTTLGFFLMTRESKYHHSAIIPLIIAAFFDLFSTSILLLTLIIYIWNNKRENILSNHTKKNKIYLLIISILLLINWLLLNQPFFLGPFHIEQTIPDLISDLGGLSGISFFSFLLFIIGMSITWKNKSCGKAYLFLPFIIPAYYYSTQTIMIISFVIFFFATIGLVSLLERKWLLQNIRNFTFLLLFLGILFSLLTYLNRSSDFSPTLSDQNSLNWIKENTAEEAIVFSDSENAEYIRYFAQHPSFSSLNANLTIKNTTAAILNANYIQDLFPLLEQNNIKIIYINSKMKEKLPKEQGLLFLLKNERFKLVHSYDESEVWMFLEEKKETESKIKKN